MMSRGRKWWTVKWGQNELASWSNTWIHCGGLVEWSYRAITRPPSAAFGDIGDSKGHIITGSVLVWMNWRKRDSQAAGGGCGEEEPQILLCIKVCAIWNQTRQPCEARASFKKKKKKRSNLWLGRESLADTVLPQMATVESPNEEWRREKATCDTRLLLRARLAPVQPVGGWTGSGPGRKIHFWWELATLQRLSTLRRNGDPFHGH